MIEARPLRPHRLLLAVLLSMVVGAAVAPTDIVVGAPVAADPGDGGTTPIRAGAVAEPLVDPSLYGALEYRFLGPYRNGRSSTVTGVPDDPHTFFMGSAGGVWRSDDAGNTWYNVSDGQMAVGSIGAIAVAPSDPNVLYVGTGQETIRGNVSTGIGVYRSTDGGDTWRHVGLADAGQISAVRVHPRDPDLVYVAAVGHAFGPNEERGVYRSRDGGETWERVFHLSAETGIADLAMDPTRPQVLYAAAWTAVRKPWTIVSGGPESGLFRSVDGGDTWTELTDPGLDNGLPDGLLGKIGVDISAANPDRVWALIEAEPEVAGLYRSDDGGESWRRMETNQGRRLYQRSWYYMHVFADPSDEDTVYVLNVDQFVSEDGGRTFEEIDTVRHGDGHDLWVNPRNPEIVIMGFDGGAVVTLDGLRTWSSLNNQPTAEIYYLFVDEQFPYNVYGPQQDNSTIRLPSRFTGALTPTGYWENVGGCENGHIAFDPHDPTVVYAGCYGGEITRVDLETGEYRMIMAYPQMEVGRAPKDLRYRFNWNAPIRISPHDPEVVYHASNVVHRTTNGGQSWEVISPDLTRDDPAKQDYAGEPITMENTGAEVYDTIVAFEESAREPGVLWAGSDDGLVHVSRDGGETWTDVTPEGLPKWGRVNVIDLSPHDPGRAFVSVLRHRIDDWRPYAFRTDDYGRTWEPLVEIEGSVTGDGEPGDLTAIEGLRTNGIPANHPIRVLREDPERRGLLYAGTEFGIYVSFDDGGHWQPLQLDLPEVPVTDLRVHRQDLVVATQGRGFWILDDVTPLHQIQERLGLADARSAGDEETATFDEEPFLFRPRDAYRMDLESDPGPAQRGGENPPDGAMIFYTLPREREAEVTLEIRGPDGGTVRAFSSEHPPEPDPPVIYLGDKGQQLVPAEAGMNRFVWNMRHAPVDIAEDVLVWGFTGGPRAKPGEYEVVLSVGDWSRSRTFSVLKDPRVSATQEEFDEQLDLLLEMRDDLDRLYDGIRTARSVREQVRDLVERVEEAGRVDEEELAGLDEASESLAGKMTGIIEELMQPKTEADQDVENFPTRIDNQLAFVYWHVDMADARPTDGQRERYGDLKAELDEVLSRLREILDTDLAEFNDRVRRLEIPPIVVR